MHVNISSLCDETIQTPFQQQQQQQLRAFARGIPTKSKQTAWTNDNFEVLSSLEGDGILHVTAVHCVGQTASQQQAIIIPSTNPYVHE